MAPEPTDRTAVSSTGEVLHLQIPPAESAEPVSIVTLGGGTGLSTLLRGLRDLVGELERREPSSVSPELAAIVTVTDDGGSSGRLRRDFDMLAPGDIRNCMVALAEDEALLSKLFRYRFEAGEGLEGHSFGNLFLTALSDVTGDFHKAIRLSSEVLAIKRPDLPLDAGRTSLSKRSSRAAARWWARLEHHRLPRRHQACQSAARESRSRRRARCRRSPRRM